jgi:hypothetical protein
VSIEGSGRFWRSVARRYGSAPFAREVVVGTSKVIAKIKNNSLMLSYRIINDLKGAKGKSKIVP